MTIGSVVAAGPPSAWRLLVGGRDHQNRKLQPVPQGSDTVNRLWLQAVHQKPADSARPMPIGATGSSCDGFAARVRLSFLGKLAVSAAFLISTSPLAAGELEIIRCGIENDSAGADSSSIHSHGRSPAQAILMATETIPPVEPPRRDPSPQPAPRRAKRRAAALAVAADASGRRGVCGRFSLWAEGMVRRRSDRQS